MFGTFNLINRWENDLNRYFSKEEIHMANKYMRKCSTSLAIRKTQNYTEISLTPVRIAIIKDSNNNNCCEDEETV